MKNNIYRIIAGILFPIFFVVMFFIFGGIEHEATCWIGFGFILFSYALMIATPLFIPSSKSTHLFGATNGKLSGTYFAVNFVFGLIFMIWDFKNWKIALIIEVILLAGFVLLISTVFQTDKITAIKENKQQEEVSAVKALVAKSNMIMGRAGNFEIKKLVQKVYNELVTCPTNSNPAVKSIDDSISFNLDILNQSVMTNDVASVNNNVTILIRLIKERKEISK